MPSLRSGITSGLGLCIRPYRYASQLVRRYYCQTSVWCQLAGHRYYPFQHEKLIGVHVSQEGTLHLRMLERIYPHKKTGFSVLSSYFFSAAHTCTFFDHVTPTIFSCHYCLLVPYTKFMDSKNLTILQNKRRRWL